MRRLATALAMGAATAALMGSAGVAAAMGPGDPPVSEAECEAQNGLVVPLPNHDFSTAWVCHAPGNAELSGTPVTLDEDS